jgi:hypothetical protein
VHLFRKNLHILFLEHPFSYPTNATPLKIRARPPYPT